MSRELTRRAAVAAIAVTAPVMARAAPAADAELLELGRRFEEITAAIDREIEPAASDRTLDRLAVIEPAIVTMPATTIDGMRVKARAAAWALLGDLDPTMCGTTDARMALSIVRDLIRLYDQDRERPGALAKLVAENERDAES